jgi:hypothetical protein
LNGGFPVAANDCVREGLDRDAAPELLSIGQTLDKQFGC